MAEMAGVPGWQPQMRETTQMICNFIASPRRLILNKFRINGMFSGENLVSGLVGWKNSLYYNVTAEARTYDLPHIMTVAIGK